MKCVKKGVSIDGQIFTGTCSRCRSVFEAERKELQVNICPRERYEYARADCSECESKNSLVLYPKKQ